MPREDLTVRELWERAHRTGEAKDVERFRAAIKELWKVMDSIEDEGAQS